MSDLRLRLIAGAMLGAAVALMTALQARCESRQAIGMGGTVYRNPLAGWMLYLPLYLPLALLTVPVTPWARYAEIWAQFLTVAVTAAVYFTLLLLLLPLLRRCFSASACALLWLMPNVTFLARTLYNRPELCRRVPVDGGILRLLFWLWLAGFAMIFGGKLFEHIRFQHSLERSARPVDDADILALWENEQAALGTKRYALRRSPLLKTPLSLGFTEASTTVYLPERLYSPDELRLVFRHELVHIQRSDCLLKFFMIFCTAMCWFNPLLWFAMRRCAEDIELSCDEAVTLLLDASQRQAYAALLLTTAGDARGFTTCLSASARSLRYRLHCVVAPRRKASGIVLLALCCFLLVSSFGLISFVPA